MIAHSGGAPNRQDDALRGLLEVEAHIRPILDELAGEGEGDDILIVVSPLPEAGSNEGQANSM